MEHVVERGMMGVGTGERVRASQIGRRALEATGRGEQSEPLRPCEKARTRSHFYFGKVSCTVENGLCGRREEAEEVGGRAVI